MVHLSRKLNWQPKIRVAEVPLTLCDVNVNVSDKLKDWKMLSISARPLLIRCVRPSVRPSTSMINCRSMHFKNVNLSYMPRSIRLSPQKETDRQKGRQIGRGTDRERQTERQSRSSKRKENLCKKMLQTSYRNQIKNV